MHSDFRCITLLTACLALLISGAGCDNGGLCPHSSCEANRPDGADLKADFPSFVVKHIRGRLGNHVWGYMMSLALEVRFGVRSLITRECADYLHKYFEDVNFPVAEDVCGYEEYYSAFLRYLDTRIMAHYEEQLGYKIDEPFPRDENNRMIVPQDIHDRVKINTYSIIDQEGFWPNFKPEFEQECAYNWKPFLHKFSAMSEPEHSRGRHWHLHPSSPRGDEGEIYTQIPDFGDYFRSRLRLKGEFLRAADAKLHEIKSTHLQMLRQKLKKVKASKEFLFVGIHSRRTDHIEYELKFGYTPIKYMYYLEAMDMFRDAFRKTHRVVFVFVSDDMAWGKEKLKVRNNQRDLYFAGDGKVDNIDSIGGDLALLAACNHTIQSHGSFSYLAGVLANGIRIIPEHFAEYRTDTSWVYPVVRDPIQEPLLDVYFFSQMEKIPVNKRRLYSER